MQEIVDTVCQQLIALGARAMILTGSQARGTAGLLSDIDIYAIGDGPAYHLEVHNGRLVSISWRTVEQIAGEMLSPSTAFSTVSGWRWATILHDPDGIAAGIQRQANAWTWDIIGDGALNAWVAEELTGYAEEVLKLVRLVQEKDKQTAAAVQRSVLALRIPSIMAVHLRVLYVNEDALWESMGRVLESKWQQRYREALGMGSSGFIESCQAALHLYRMAAEYVLPISDERQRAVLRLACEVIGPEV